MDVDREYDLISIGAAVTPLEVRLATYEREWTINNDFIFTMIGNLPDIGFLTAAGVELANGGKPAYNEDTFEANVPGIFVTGSLSRESHIFNGRHRAVKIVRYIGEKLRA